MTASHQMLQSTLQQSHIPAEDLRRFMLKSMARDTTVSDSRWVRKILNGWKRKPRSCRPAIKSNACYFEEFPLCKDGNEDPICDYWCDEFNVIDVCEGASYASAACLSTLLAETTVDTPRWTCNRHSHSRSSSSQHSSTYCCNLDKDLPALPSALSSSDYLAQERWSNLGSFFCQGLTLKETHMIELHMFQQPCMKTPMSQTRASSGVFAELTNNT